jgi:hypothetical protein
MASKVGLWNVALQRLGTRRVDTDTEDTAEAEALDAVYDETLLYVLGEYPWSFARSVVQLAQQVATPTTVWAYFYDLPSDLVSLLRVSDGVDNYEWQTGPSIPYERQEDDRIATDAEAAYLYYVKAVSDINQMSPSFRSALAWRLAMAVSYRLTESTTKADRCEFKYNQELEVAKSKDSIKSRIRPINPSSWVTSRESGSSTSEWD